MQQAETITPRQHEALEQFARSPGITTSEVAKRLGITATSLASLMEPLLRRGLLRRVGTVTIGHGCGSCSTCGQPVYRPRLTVRKPGKLTEWQRTQIATSKAKPDSVARRFGVCVETVYDIKRRHAAGAAKEHT